MKASIANNILLLCILALPAAFAAVGHPSEDIKAGHFRGDNYIFDGDLQVLGTFSYSGAGGEWSVSGSDIYYDSGSVAIGTTPDSSQELLAQSGRDAVVRIRNTGSGHDLYSEGDKSYFAGRLGVGILPDTFPMSSDLGAREVYTGKILFDNGDIKDDGVSGLALTTGGSVSVDADSGLYVKQGGVRIDDAQIHFGEAGNPDGVMSYSYDNGFELDADNGIKTKGQMTIESSSGNSVLMLSSSHAFSAVDFYNGFSQRWGLGKDDTDSFYIGQPGHDRLRILPGGNVGIGVDNPAEKLEVDGNIMTTGSLMFTDSNAAIRRSSDNLILSSPDRIRLLPATSVRIGSDTSITGDLSVTGDIIGSSCCSSDVRLKKDIESIADPLATLMKLRGVRFRWKDPEMFGKRSGNLEQMGFIAQDVEKILPDWVIEDSSGRKYLRKDGFDALIVEAVKEQQSEIESLRSEIAALKDEICSARSKESSLCSS